MKKNLLYTLLAFLFTLQASAQNKASYTYDANNQLTQVVYANGTTVKYTYDALGNRLSKKVTTTTVQKQYTVTLTASPAEGGKVTGAGTYVEGTSITINAIPNEGYEFTKWSDGNTNATRTLAINQNYNLTATFTKKSATIKQYTVALTANPAEGGKVTGAGTYNENVSVGISAVANAGYEFTQWSDGNTSATRALFMNQNYSLTAFFTKKNVAIKQYTVTLVADPAEGGKVTGAGTYNENVSVAISAVPNEGYEFTKWSDGNTNATRMLFMNQNYQLKAIFTKKNVPIKQYTVALSASPAEGGKVTGAGTYNQNVSVGISAVANAGYEFTQWSDGNTNATRTLFMNQDYSLTAFFTKKNVTIKQYTVTLVASPAEGGKVIGSGTYNENVSVPIKAIANSGYTFLRWSDNNVQSERNIQVKGNLTLYAYFSKDEASTGIFGDVNSDGVVNDKDAEYIRNAYLGMPLDIGRCDLDGDGRLTVVDVTIMNAVLNGTYKK